MQWLALNLKNLGMNNQWSMNHIPKKKKKKKIGLDVM